MGPVPGSTLISPPGVIHLQVGALRNCAPIASPRRKDNGSTTRTRILLQALCTKSQDLPADKRRPGQAATGSQLPVPATDQGQVSLGRSSCMRMLLATSVAVWPALEGAAQAEAETATEKREKRKNLSIEEIKDIIAADIRDRQYFVTGRLTQEIYSDQCRFKDPTNDTQGLAKYLAVVSILFDPQTSQQELLGIRVAGADSVEAQWRLGGYLQFPWRPRVLPFEGSTTYAIGPDGLIVKHEERWSISPFTALLETLTPSFFGQLL